MSSIIALHHKSVLLSFKGVIVLYTFFTHSHLSNISQIIITFKKPILNYIY